MIRISLSKLFEVCPNAKQPYREGFLCANSVLLLFGVMKNELRPAHFLAQTLHESGALTVFQENLYYTTPERVKVVWPNRFPTVESARPFLRNPEKLAEHVYGGRMGNESPGDGWKFRGRGPIQITGRDMYLAVGSALEVDFVKEPDLVFSPEYILPVAAHIWKLKGCNAKADRDDVVAVTKAINGGLNGLADRRRWLAKTRSMVQET